jgi:hypothetical protein
MTFDDLQEDLLPILHKLLAERLKYSREWNNVSIETGKRHFEIRWFDPKTQEGRDVFSSRRVSPFNVKTLTCEIKRQFLKLQEEQK